MILPADAELISRDLKLQELSGTLDPDWIAGRLSSVLNRDLRVHVDYLRYKPGTSCLVGGVCEIDNRKTPLHVVTLAAGEEKLASWAEQGGLRLTTHTMAFLFPDDSELQQLRTILSTQGQAEMLRRVYEGFTTNKISLRPIAYKPQRRCVFKVESEDKPHSVLKAYDSSRFERARRNSKLLIRGEVIRTPQRLGRSGSKRLIAFDWLEGETWVDKLDAAKATDADAKRVGRALAEFHRLGRSRIERALAAVPVDIEAYGSNLALLDLSQSKRVMELVQRLLSDSLPPSEPLVCHGDFYPKQVVLMAGEEVGLIDFDDARIGAAEEDLGNCIAHLHRMELAGRIHAALRETQCQMFLRGYENADGTIDSALLKRCAARSLFRLAMQPCRDRVFDWPIQQKRILDRAELLLEDQDV